MLYCSINRITNNYISTTLMTNCTLYANLAVNAAKLYNYILLSISILCVTHNIVPALCSIDSYFSMIARPWTFSVHCCHRRHGYRLSLFYIDTLIYCILKTYKTKCQCLIYKWFRIIYKYQNIRTGLRENCKFSQIPFC